MSYATWIDALPTRLKTQEEKLVILRQKFLPEPTIDYKTLFGHLKIRMAMEKTSAEIKLHRDKLRIMYK